MKTIPFYLLIFIFFGSFTTVFAQDEFYSTNKTTETKAVSIDTVDLYNYTTEQDFLEANRDVEIYTVADAETEEENERIKQRRNIRAEVVAEIVVDVFINTVFIIAAFWQ